MKKSYVLGMGVAAALSMALMGPVAQAQQKAPEQKPATTAPATTTPAVKADAKKAEPAKKAEKAASPCKGLEEKTCGTTAGCGWRAEAVVKKEGPRKGQKIAAHCRKDTPPPAAKKAAAGATPAAGASTTAPVTTTKPATGVTPPPAAAGTPPAKKN